MFEAWAHSECGLDYMKMAQYTPQELNRLQLGYLKREHRDDRSTLDSPGPVGKQRSSLGPVESVELN